MANIKNVLKTIVGIFPESSQEWVGGIDRAIDQYPNELGGANAVNLDFPDAKMDVEKNNASFLNLIRDINTMYSSQEIQVDTVILIEDWIARLEKKSEEDDETRLHRIAKGIRVAQGKISASNNFDEREKLIKDNLMASDYLQQILDADRDMLGSLVATLNIVHQDVLDKKWEVTQLFEKIELPEPRVRIMKSPPKVEEPKPKQPSLSEMQKVIAMQREADAAREAERLAAIKLASLKTVIASKAESASKATTPPASPAPKKEPSWVSVTFFSRSVASPPTFVQGASQVSDSLAKHKKEEKQLKNKGFSSFLQGVTSLMSASQEVSVDSKTKTSPSSSTKSSPSLSPLSLPSTAPGSPESSSVNSSPSASPRSKTRR